MTLNRLINYTTKEEGEELLRIGVPKNSADCYIGRDNNPHIINDAITKICVEDNHYSPCWSVGRLMEIMSICYTGENFDTEMGTGCYCGASSIVIAFGNIIKELDFTKIEF